MFCSLCRSNVTYQSSPMPPNKKVQVVDERTVHNELYTQQEIPAATTTQPPHIYDYAALGVAQGQGQGKPAAVPAQHTLLHSTLSSSDADSHVYYSKPATPNSNYDRTGNSLMAAPGALQSIDTNNYSRLNGPDQQQGDLQPQEYSEVGGGLQEQYSQIDIAHKYAKLSDNSKGYSQLGTCETQAPTSSAAAAAAASVEQQTHELAQPYEVPFSPGAQSDTPSGPSDHAYSTLAVEDDGMSGYSKLRVGEGSFQKQQQQQLGTGNTGKTGVGGADLVSELEDNNVYESASLDGEEFVAAHYELETVPDADNIASQ